jgi:hypothetical protein
MRPRSAGCTGQPELVGPMLRPIYSLVLQINSNPAPQGPFPLLLSRYELLFECECQEWSPGARLNGRRLSPRPARRHCNPAGRDRGDPRPISAREAVTTRHRAMRRA